MGHVSAGRALLRLAANPMWARRAVAVIFLATISTFAVGSLKRMVGDRATFPAVRSWKKLPDQFESYLNEHLAGRYSLLKANARLKIGALDVSPSPRVWIGSDGWLFFNHRAEMPPERLTPEGDADNAEYWGRLLRARRDWCEARQARFLALVAPDKQSIYPECLPERIRKRGDNRVLDHVLESCRAEPAVRFVDPRRALRAGKAERAVYLRADTHWAPYGAWLCYRELAAAMRSAVPSLSPLTDSDLIPEMRPMGCCDLWWLLALCGSPPVEQVWWPNIKTSRASRVFDDTLIQTADRYGHLRPGIWTNPNSTGPRVVLYCDSFADDRFQELLAQHCARLVVIPSSRMVESVVERERPDWVICEMVERTLVNSQPPFPESN